MRRHLLVTLALAACGGKQAAPAAHDPEPEHTVEAAPDATPEPFVPEVPPLERTADVDALRAQVAAAADDHERLILKALLAEALWQASCPGAVDGLCVATPARGKKAAPTCDGHTSDRVLAKRAATDEVEQLIGEVQQAWGGGSALLPVGDPPTRRDAAAYVTDVHLAEELAATLLILGDAAYERVLAIAPPTKLDYSTTKKMNATVARLQAWFDASTAAVTTALEQYGMIAEDRDLQRWAPEAVLRSHVRSASLYQELAARFRGTEIPAGAKGATKADFCKTRADQGLEMDIAASGAWDSCVAFAEQHGSTSPWLATCYAGVEATAPKESP